MLNWPPLYSGEVLLVMTYDSIQLLYDRSMYRGKEFSVCLNIFYSGIKYTEKDWILCNVFSSVYQYAT